MTVRKRSQFQIDTTDEIRNRAKALALEGGYKTLGDFVHNALAKVGDPKLTKLIEEFLETRRQPGRLPKEK
jgi:hypothetical protein